MTRPEKTCAADMTWSPDLARKTYSIPHWSDGYFDVGDDGRIVVAPKGSAGPKIALAEAVDRAMSAGANLPMLVRFPDILGDRLGKPEEVLRGVAFDGAHVDVDHVGTAGELLLQ